MKYFVRELVILDKGQKVAKKVEFTNSINVVTSSVNDGNWVGKSSILRSIYHAMGADGLFPSDWDPAKTVCYLLKFEFNSISGCIFRDHNLFIVEYNGTQTKCIKRSELSSVLSRIFGISLELKNREGKYTLTSPAYWYLLNYIDQRAIFCCKFESFSNLNEYPNYYTDLLYTHLGLDSDEYNRLQSSKDDELTKKNFYEEQYELKNSLLKELENKSIDNCDSLDYQSLRKEFDFKRDDYKKLSIELSSIKNIIFKLENNKNDLEIYLNDLKNSISRHQKEVKNTPNHQCPFCNSEIKDEISLIVNTEVWKNDALFEIIELERSITDINDKIKRSFDTYEKLSEKLDELEKEIQNSTIKGDIALETLGIKRIKKDLISDIDSILKNIKIISDNLKQLNKDLRKLGGIKKSINEEYYSIISEYIRNYEMPIEHDHVMKVDSKFSVDSTRTNIMSVIWRSSLIKTRKKFNKNFVDFPIVFDNPNNADLANENKKNIFDIILKDLPSYGQIITSCVGFNEMKFSREMDINIIMLDNPKNHLLNSDDYEKCYLEINEFLSK